MEAFSNPRTKTATLAAKLERTARQLNPTPGLSNAERMRIRRTLDGIKERMTYWLGVTEDKEFAWFPFTGTITEKAEEHYYTCKSFYEQSRCDDFGYLEKFHDVKQIATNKISVASWYVNNLERGFYVVKVIHSPIPCDEWGWLPLSRKQWNVIVLEIMACHQLWQWVHAVREYTNDKSFKPGGVIGWHMERARNIYTKDYSPCTGQVIYSHVLEKYSQQDFIK